MEAVLNNTFPEKSSSTNVKVAEELHAFSTFDIDAINYSVAFIHSAGVLQADRSGATDLHVDRIGCAHSHSLQNPIKNIIQRPT
ncbi:MAG: hypothetical protein WC615_01470 [Mucilaginibacter sp.]|jgi:hypothetical protein|uniref:hypothetical protein n=1 Tax=Mucilaginibacter sp. TaxID=1882438 RepID=UPI0035650116